MTRCVSKSGDGLMKDETHLSRKLQPTMSDEDVRHLAKQAISVLASGVDTLPVALSERLIALGDAFIDSDESLHHEALTRLRADGVPARDVIDYVIPATARVLGQRWLDDELSFVHVTIGAARLQEAVRGLSSGHHRQRPRGPFIEAPRILILVPYMEQHTLGPFVLADQFRRLGYNVDVMVDVRPKDIAPRLHTRRYRMIGISSAGRRTLASAKDLVETIRTSVTRVTPIVIGGVSLNQGEAVLKQTGADFIAQDAATALRMCGLPIDLAGPEPDELEQAYRRERARGDEVLGR